MVAYRHAALLVSGKDRSDAEDRTQTLIMYQRMDSHE